MPDDLFHGGAPTEYSGAWSNQTRRPPDPDSCNSDLYRLDSAPRLTRISYHFVDSGDSYIVRSRPIKERVHINCRAYDGIAQVFVTAFAYAAVLG